MLEHKERGLIPKSRTLGDHYLETMWFTGLGRQAGPMIPGGRKDLFAILEQQPARPPGTMPADWADDAWLTMRGRPTQPGQPAVFCKCLTCACLMAFGSPAWQCLLVFPVTCV